MTTRIPSLLIFALAAALAQAAPPKNVILMIADGAGFNSFKAAAMFEGKLGNTVFDGPGWKHGAVATFPLNLSSKATGNSTQDPKVVYDPAKAWSATQKDGKWAYPWLTSTATDSAAAATAMATGTKTYNNAICWSNLDQPLTNVHQIMKQRGKSTGVVTSVPWTHATPAGMVAHNRSRNDYAGIGREMIYRSGMDLIMGAGHPLYDDNGRRIAKVDPKAKAAYVGGWSSFYDLEDGRTPYRFIQARSEFEALANGKLDLQGKRRVLGTAQVASTLQQGRSTQDWNGDGKVGADDLKAAPVGGDPQVRTVPSLATMTSGALRFLGRNPKGFFLMVEGGAVDWANHGNQPGRMIEEATDFFRAVEQVVAWVERNGGWKENLVIITADHDTGLPLGPANASNAFAEMVDRGKGRIPGLGYNTGGHSNSLVPLFAKGPGSGRFDALVSGKDPRYGPFIQNTDIFRLMTGL